MSNSRTNNMGESTSSEASSCSAVDTETIERAFPEF